MGCHDAMLSGGECCRAEPPRAGAVGGSARGVARGSLRRDPGLSRAGDSLRRMAAPACRSAVSARKAAVY